MNRHLALAIAAACISLPAAAQDEEKPIAPPGLPAGFDWSFNFDATWGVFGFANSLYTNPKPDQPSGDLSDNWMEGSIKPALSATYAMSGDAQLYANSNVAALLVNGTDEEAGKLAEAIASLQ